MNLRPTRRYRAFGRTTIGTIAAASANICGKQAMAQSGGSPIIQYGSASDGADAGSVTDPSDITMTFGVYFVSMEGGQYGITDGVTLSLSAGADSTNNPVSFDYNLAIILTNTSSSSVNVTWQHTITAACSTEGAVDAAYADMTLAGASVGGDLPNIDYGNMFSQSASTGAVPATAPANAATPVATGTADGGASGSDSC